MKAIVWTKYGPPDGLKLQDVERPVPRDDEVLARVHAVSVIMGISWRANSAGSSSGFNMPPFSGCLPA